MVSGAVRRLEERVRGLGWRVTFEESPTIWPALEMTRIAVLSGSSVKLTGAVLHGIADERATDCLAALILDGLGVAGANGAIGSAASQG